MTIFFCIGKFDGFSFMRSPKYLRFSFGFVSIWVIYLDLEQALHTTLIDGRWEEKVFDYLKSDSGK